MRPLPDPYEPEPYRRRCLREADSGLAATACLRARLGLVLRRNSLCSAESCQFWQESDSVGRIRWTHDRDPTLARGSVALAIIAPASVRDVRLLVAGKIERSALHGLRHPL